jgi:hypothetical protein
MHCDLCITISLIFFAGAQDYLSQFVNSQMFTQFITDRLTRSPREYEVLFFDEIIKLKLNRSKLKLLKEGTPFLDVSMLCFYSMIVMMMPVIQILTHTNKG